MTSVYKDAKAQREVRRWCEGRIADWGVPHVRGEVVTSAGVTSFVRAGDEPREGEPGVVLLPGTNMNAALCLPLVGPLARGRRVTVLDLPGQPGLSAGGRPRVRRMAWYGQWLSEALESAAPGPAVVVGHSLGGAVALACGSPQIVGRVLLSSAGITWLRVPAPLLAATVPWLLRPSVPRSTALLRRMAAPGGGEVPDHLSTWMDLVARCCRTSLAPPPLPSGLLEQRRPVPALVVAGRFDPFLPPRALGPSARRRLGAEFRVMEGAGHLLLDEAPDAVPALVEEFCAAFAAG
ncbi:alpha/beta hydrolase [Streptomyces sp. ISL-112]|uniref:alpha/beta fold hydrolase n=1 Tax=unclassified Streptomyces TaxID=2593676 RepID=UPI001BE50262|nr:MULTISPECIES: alpha/beta hydrolase [unclassified Streptomyces]MBT2426762.1 alpha/beta hydrolase [Streptomyces sp. ISL-112]MBT2463339.1 alpha/beta hydrolase [Streptomyces sp. ISL-63]